MKTSISIRDRLEQKKMSLHRANKVLNALELAGFDSRDFYTAPFIVLSRAYEFRGNRIVRICKSTMKILFIGK